MRTTLTIDEDVLRVARSLAEAEGKSLGAVISELVRRALRPAPSRIEDGIPMFDVQPDVAPITDEMVRAALDD